ncbi:LolA family protein [Alicyclobacillus macrosporangiidus]|uniref:LolA family protein n=1 Tax=Alicyclobacillus macrosporangiidus TaxID=392015 RepID=UPI000494DC0B|nr:hypothetical protein [Alicyclobacillus macrosporangiidus]
MRKVSGMLVAVGLAAALAAGCGAPSKDAMNAKLQTQQEKLSASNYQSTAKMTVQMENGSQTYYIETDYDSPEVYKISLGDANKNINQIIVRNGSGMFVVSPTLQKVFRFNGNWAQNQGHIYLYDQILHQLSTSPDVKVAKKGDVYTFTMPITPENDIVAKQQVDLSVNTLEPKKVVLYDKDNKAVVTIEFTSFKTGVKYQQADFDPQKLASSGAVKTTTVQDNQFTFVEPQEILGDKQDLSDQLSATDWLLRYTGPYDFTLEEWRPDPGVAGVPGGKLVDLFGVPAVLAGSANAQRLMWIHNGVQFSLTSDKLSLDQMKQVAISTFGQVGK